MLCHLKYLGSIGEKPRSSKATKSPRHLYFLRRQEIAHVLTNGPVQASLTDLLYPSPLGNLDISSHTGHLCKPLSSVHCRSLLTGHASGC